MTEGIIFKALSGFYYVHSAEGDIQCKARGRFRLDNTSPLVGDYVVYQNTEAGHGYITQIHERKNAFIRPAIANLDRLVIIASASIPITDPFLIDRMTAIAHQKDCEAIICINKCDLDPADKLYDVYSSAGFNTIRTSAASGEGVDELKRAISKGICAFTGNSGVGKSSLLNKLDPDFNIKVGEVSKKLGRGRHTTRHIELFKLADNAIVADTPGFSAFDTNQLYEEEKLQYLFPDFKKLIGSCQFDDCAHIAEPNCAVINALKSNELNTSRYRSYVRLYKQAMKTKKWDIKSD